LKVSFICPVFNKLKFLPRVTKGIFDQIGSFDREYIFIDDGSQDGSLDEIKKLTKKKKSVKIISHDNRGPAFSTQRGIQFAKGDYIKLIGGDDYIFPKCTSVLLEGLKKTNTVAIFSNYILEDYLQKKVDDKLCKTKLSNLRKIIKPTNETLLRCFSGTSPTLYCHKAIKKSDGCNVKLFVEDFSLALELSKMGNFAFIDNITSVGPKNDESRIMINNEAQLFHDYNAAIYFFLKKNKLDNKSLLRKITVKCLGRSSKYARRILKEKFFNEMTLLRIGIFLKYNSESKLIDLIKKSCEFFYRSEVKSKIRYKI
tara:strand:+ start:1353 stop:2291 length:939 start_codon:yes stop_codon:yes gene_type:complete